MVVMGGNIEVKCSGVEGVAYNWWGLKGGIRIGIGMAFWWFRVDRRLGYWYTLWVVWFN